jgi:hypothetical protein
MIALRSGNIFYRLNLLPRMLPRQSRGYAWAYGASFDREPERHIPEAGLELIESLYVVDDLLKMLTARSP